MIKEQFVSFDAARMLKVVRLGTMRYWNLRNKGGNNE